MNNLQQIASDISGYIPLNFYDAYIPSEQGARDDYYYDECHTTQEKIYQIKHYAENVSELYISSAEIYRVMGFLEKLKNSEHCDRDVDFMSLI
jgi:hypothetical protein